MLGYLQLVRNYEDEFWCVCEMATLNSYIHKTLLYQIIRREVNALVT